MRKGPFTTDEIKEMDSQVPFLPGTMVKGSGMPDFLPFKEVEWAIRI